MITIIGKLIFPYVIISRKELIEDPWNEALKEKYHVGILLRLLVSHWRKLIGLGKSQDF